jgi:sugar phosphate isomerase/epimerase
MLKTAFHTGYLGNFPIEEVIRMVRDHGYDQVEINAEQLPWGRPHIAPETPTKDIDRLAKLGPFSALSAHHNELGSPNPEHARYATAWTIRLMDVALDLGIDIVHVIPGGDAEQQSLYRCLSDCHEAAQKKKITLALEPIVGRIIGTTATALDALAAVPGLAINFDPSHLQVMGDNTVEAAHVLGPHSAHMHLKDARGTLDDWAFVPLGQGEIDLEGTVRAMIAEGFDRTISVEHESHYFAGDVRPPEQVLAESKAFLDKVIVDHTTRATAAQPLKPSLQRA